MCKIKKLFYPIDLLEFELIAVETVDADERFGNGPNFSYVIATTTDA